MKSNSPGARLRDLLKILIPLDNFANGLDSNIDDVFKSDGDFEEITYNSCINYIVRRLIATASYTLKRNFKMTKIHLESTSSNFDIIYQKIRDLIKLELRNYYPC